MKTFEEVAPAAVGDGLPLLAVVESLRPAGLDMPVDHDAYREECRARWEGPALSDALCRWRQWQELRPVLLQAMLRFKANPCGEQPDGSFTNGDGTLTSFLWSLQKDLQASPAHLNPLLDFCNHYQKVHLARGLVIYCKALLRIIEAVAGEGARAPGEPLPTRPNVRALASAATGGGSAV